MNSKVNLITNALKEAIPSLKGIYLFGSRAENTARPDSDYDLAFLAPDHLLDDEALYRLRLRLAALLDADVDLIDLGQASTVLQFQIVAKGIRVFSDDDLFCDTFDLFVFSSYQHLNEGQAEILQDIRQRRSVYAG
ncbi:MAG: nucleotidyltransferase domain-containing protein [Thermoanaerobaculia bacterium]|nr:nucleotidyltransferase domain-containing protein [Thermoanaerobaculia bacterium]